MSQIYKPNSSGGGGGNVETITGNDGIATHPTGNNINIVGLTVANATNAIPVYVKHTATSTDSIEVQVAEAVGSSNINNAGLASFNSAQFTVDANGYVSSTASTVDLHVARFIVSAGGNTDGANYTTIAAAYAAAVAATGNQTVFIQPGTYTENITLSANVNLAAFDCDALTPNVIILGKLTATFAGTCSISGIRLKTNSDYCLEVTGSSATVINLKNCFVEANNNTAIHFTSSSGSSKIFLFQCRGQLETTGIAYFTHTAAGALSFNGGLFENDGLSTTASTLTSNVGGSVTIRDGYFSNSITTSGSGAANELINTEYHGTLTVNSTLAAGTNLAFNTTMTAYGSDTALSLGAGSSFTLSSVQIFSTNTNAIAGSGTLLYGDVSFDGSSSTIQNTVVKTALTTDMGQLNLLTALTVPNGGTGDTSFTAYSVICGGTTSTGALQNVSGVGSSGQVLTSNGAAQLPTWQAAGGFTPVNFSVKLSGNVAGVTGDGTDYLIAYDTVTFDSASGFNTGTHKYTIPTTGVYQFNATWFVYTSSGTNTSTAFLGFLIINGSTNVRLCDAAPGALGLTTNSEFMAGGTFLYSATAGDTIEMHVNLTGGTKNIGVAGGTESCLFSGFRVA